MQDALNRYPDSTNVHQTVHLMKYIFPLQFGLHNVFTSKVDAKETAQPLKDYTLREQEIIQQERRLIQKAPHVQDLGQRVPKRLRGKSLMLVQDLQKRKYQCSIPELLKHYCPTVIDDSKSNSKRKKSSQSRKGRTQQLDESTLLQPRIPNAEGASDLSNASVCDTIPRVAGIKRSFMDLATPHAHVSAFCRASISKLIPKAFWGDGDVGRHNRETTMTNIDRFIKLRRFENFSLHAAIQGMKVILNRNWEKRDTYLLLVSLRVLVIFQQCCVHQNSDLRYAEAQRNISRIFILCI